MGCALNRDFTLQKTIIPAVLDVPLSLQYVSQTVQPLSFLLEARLDGATKKLPATRLGLPSVLAKPSIWHRGFGFS